MIYAFTGPHRDLSPREDQLINAIVGSLRGPTGLRFGGAHGVDTAAARAAYAHWPDVDRVIIQPRAPWSEEVPPGTRLEWAAAGRNAGDAYMRRNTRLVGTPTDVLIAFPETAAEPGNPRAGGGTWATVRRARRRSLPIYVFPLDGSDPFVNLPEDQVSSAQIRSAHLSAHMPRAVPALGGRFYG